MKPYLNRHQLQKENGFTLMEVSLSLGIAATWILLALGLISVLVDQVQKHRQVPLLEAKEERVESSSFIWPQALEERDTP